jgi:hypothetical protein
MNRSTLCAAWLAVLAATSSAQTVYPTGTTLLDTSKAFLGYTLFDPQGDDGIVMIDMQGNVVHRWDSPVPGEILANVFPLENGNILVLSRASNAPSHSAYELDINGNAVWSYELDPAEGYIHHDIQRMSNGNTVLLCAQDIVVPSISSNPLIDDFLRVVNPEGEVIGSWYTWQHFNEFGFSPDQEQLIFDNGGDWAHTNAAAGLPANSHVDPALAEGNVIVSQRFTNIVFIADFITGQVVWQSGPDDNLTWGQHDSHMIEEGLPGAGNILVFNNGAGTGYLPKSRAPGESSILEIDPVTKTVVWSYEATNSGLFRKLFWSDIVSSAQRLPNGNTLICSGTKGRLFEITTDGEIVWEYMSPFVGNAGPAKTVLVYRAYRVPLSWAFLLTDPGLSVFDR